MQTGLLDAPDEPFANVGGAPPTGQAEDVAIPDRRRLEEDVVEFAPTSLGGTTSGSFVMLLDLSALGINPTEDIGALHVVD